MKIDRRLFLKRTGSGIALSTVSLNEVFAQKTKRLIGAIEEDPASINPALTTVISSFTAGCPVYSALTWMDAKGDVQPNPGRLPPTTRAIPSACVRTSSGMTVHLSAQRT